MLSSFININWHLIFYIYLFVYGHLGAMALPVDTKQQLIEVCSLLTSIQGWSSACQCQVPLLTEPSHQANICDPTHNTQETEAN